MRWGLSPNISRVAFAYLFALQTLLGAWAGTTVTASLASFDPALTLCRTLADGTPQPFDDGAAPRPHCVLMCISSTCNSGSAPAIISAVLEVLPPLAAARPIEAVREFFLLVTAPVRLSARGPPLVV